MATKATNALPPEYPACFHKPPRLPASNGSIAAFIQDNETGTRDLACAWVLLWKACGGDLTVGSNGKRFTCMPHPAQRAEGLLRPVGFSPRDEAEWRGATMVLAALLSIAGSDAVDAVFECASEARA